MQYLITGKLFRTHEVFGLPHEDFVMLVRQKVVPALQGLVGAHAHGKVLAGGCPAASRDLVMIVDLPAKDSHHGVRTFLTALPVFDYFEWQVTPLETFEELLQSFGG